MTDRQRELGERLVSHPRFQWREGMRPAGAERLTERMAALVQAAPEGAVLDLEDKANGVLLLGLLESFELYALGPDKTSDRRYHLLAGLRRREWRINGSGTAFTEAVGHAVLQAWDLYDEAGLDVGQPP